MNKTKLAIITTHPIQYYAPVFKLLAKSERLTIKVFYTLGVKSSEYDQGFERKIEWDLPLLEDYPYEFLKNKAKKKGSHRFLGIHNPDIISSIKEWNPNALLVYGWSYYSHFKVMHYFKGKIPIYFRGDSTLLDEKGGIKQIMRRLLLKWVYKHIDYAFYVGIENKKYFLKHGVKADQLFFAPHAIDNQRFADPNGNYSLKAAQWKKELGIDSKQKIILFCGKFVDIKDPFLFLYLAESLNYLSKIKFIMVGNGPLEKELKKYAYKLDNVQFLDFQNQTKMPIIYRLADIYLLPSKSETWGLAVNEAMACGKPVIVSDKVGCAVDLVDESNGKVFKAGDLQSLINATMELLSEDLEVKGHNSWLKIQKWSFDHQVNNMIDFLNNNIKVN